MGNFVDCEKCGEHHSGRCRRDAMPASQETKNGNVYTYDATGRLLTVVAASLASQCDILSTPADDKAVAALMIEADIEAPNKEQASWVLAENDSLKEKLASAMAQLKEAKEQNSELTRKAKLYDGYFGLLAQCLHDVKV